MVGMATWASGRCAMTRVDATGRVILDPGCDGPDELWAAAVRHNAPKTGLNATHSDQNPENDHTPTQTTPTPHRGVQSLDLMLTARNRRRLHRSAWRTR